MKLVDAGWSDRMGIRRKKRISRSKKSTQADDPVTPDIECGSVAGEVFGAASESGEPYLVLACLREGVTRPGLSSCRQRT